jgi:hypothetical protein
MFKGLRFYVGQCENYAYLVLWIGAIDLEDPCRHLENKTELFWSAVARPGFERGIPKIRVRCVSFLPTRSGGAEYKEKLNSVALVRKRIPTERPPLVGEVSANFFFC